MVETSGERRKIRQRRVRRKVKGTSDRPRLCVFRSLGHIYAQVIDDVEGKTLTSASTISPELKGKFKGSVNKEAAKAVGALVAEKSKEAGISKVVFDRNGFLYHGRVKALADGAREAGLEF